MVTDLVRCQQVNNMQIKSEKHSFYQAVVMAPDERGLPGCTPPAGWDTTPLSFGCDRVSG
jgi:hypothetical protein